MKAILIVQLVLINTVQRSHQSGLATTLLMANVITSRKDMRTKSWIFPYRHLASSSTQFMDHVKVRAEGIARNSKQETSFKT